MSLPVFPLPYLWEVDKSNEYVNRTIQFESGRKQKQRVSVNKLQTWKISIKGDRKQMDLLEAFHESVTGDAGQFLFNTPEGNLVVCRFADGKLPIKEIREFTLKTPTHGIIVGFQCDVTIEKVI
jgi:phage-related protein